MIVERILTVISLRPGRESRRPALPAFKRLGQRVDDGRHRHADPLLIEAVELDQLVVHVIAHHEDAAPIRHDAGQQAARHDGLGAVLRTPSASSLP